MWRMLSPKKQHLKGYNFKIVMTENGHLSSKTTPKVRILWLLMTGLVILAMAFLKYLPNMGWDKGHLPVWYTGPEYYGMPYNTMYCHGQHVNITKVYVVAHSRNWTSYLCLFIYLFIFFCYIFIVLLMNLTLSVA